MDVRPPPPEVGERVTRLLRLALRLAARLGLRGAALGALARFLVRRVGRSTAERFGRELAGIAGRTTKSAATGATRRVVETAGEVVGRSRSSVDSVRSELTIETERRRRHLRARYLEATIGPGPATDALLDIRILPSARASDDSFDDLHAAVPEPVAPGRRRHRALPTPVVARVRRSYRRPTNAWELRR